MTRWACVAYGTAATSKRLDALAVAAPAAFKRGFTKWLGMVASQSQAEVPFITGELARSMVLRVNARGGTITYGAPHAKFVHEVPRPPSSNGKWKYLEDPWKQLLPQMEKVIGAEVKASLKRGRRP